MEAATYTCDKCKGKFPVGKMRYSVDGKKFVCVNCLDIGPKTDTKTPVNLKSVEKVAMVCTSCKYKFKVSRSSKTTICPYCSKPTIVEEKGNNASNLIVESEAYDF